MSLWIAASLTAALAQALRFMLQKSLSLGGISAAGATFARFIYSAPVIFVIVVVTLTATPAVLPPLPAMFWVFVSMGGAAQIVATVLVVLLFKERHFAVGVTFKKTEVILTALTGFLLLGDRITLWAFGAIILGVVGVLVLSAKPGQKVSLGAMGNRSVALGLGSGVLFAISAVGFRGASLQLEAEPLLRAAITLSAATALQATALGAWLSLREPGTIPAVFGAWRRALALGLLSLVGSYCWFLAFTLQNAAYVKAVGQIELIFVLIIGALVFSEKVTRRELMGMALLSGSILGLLLAV